MNYNRDHTTEPALGFFLGLAVGSALGAGLALLYATQEGKKLREDIKSMAGEIIDETEEFLEDVTTKASDVVGDVKARSIHIATDAQKKARELMETAEKTLANLN